jgi:predicted amidophosphoribosyltransferase
MIQIDGMNVYALYWYNDGMSMLMHRIKELYDESLVKVFHKDLRYSLAWKYRKSYKVCVPSSNEKTSERGFHAVIGMFKPWDVHNDFEKDDVKQSLKSALDRRRIKEAIKLKHPSSNKHTNIVLVDDVCTTGSSLKACYDLLKNDENSVAIVVLAMHTIWDTQGSLTIKKK